MINNKVKEYMERFQTGYIFPNPYNKKPDVEVETSSKPIEYVQLNLELMIDE